MQNSDELLELWVRYEMNLGFKEPLVLQERRNTNKNKNRVEIIFLKFIQSNNVTVIFGRRIEE